MNQEISKGLAEVSEGLSDFCAKKGNKEYTKKFKEKAKIFKDMSKERREIEMVRPNKPLEKRAENGIKSRIDATVKKYGYDAFRIVANRYINDRREKDRLEREIKEKERELERLKRNKG